MKSPKNIYKTKKASTKKSVHKRKSTSTSKSRKRKTMVMSKQKRLRKSKSKRVRIPARKGLLMGYHVNLPLKERRKILTNNIRADLSNYSETIKRLNVLSIYNMYKHPETSKKIKRDISFLQKKFPKESQYRIY